MLSGFCPRYSRKSLGQHTGYTKRGTTVKTTAVSLYWFGLCNNSIEVSIGIIQNLFCSSRHGTHKCRYYHRRSIFDTLKKFYTNFKKKLCHAQRCDRGTKLLLITPSTPQIVVYCQIYTYFYCICQN